MEELETVKRLADDELILRVTRSVREDRRVSALLLAHLGEIDARGLYRDLGYDSMFNYAVSALHMSESEAWLRVYAAEFARRFPAALEMLSRGELHLTAMKMLSPVLTEANIELLRMACHKSKREIDLLIAKHCPKPDVPPSIRRLPDPRRTTDGGGQRARGESSTAAMPMLFRDEAAERSGGENSAAPLIHEKSSAGASRASGSDISAAPSSVTCGDGSEARRSAPASDATPECAVCPGESHLPKAVRRQGPPAQSEGSTTPNHSANPIHSTSQNNGARPAAPAVPAMNRKPVTPLSEGRFKIQFTAGQRVRDLVQEAQDLFRNQLPSGDFAVLVERALEMLVAARKKQLYALTDKPRRSSAAVAPTAARSSLASQTSGATPTSTSTPTSAEMSTPISTPTSAPISARPSTQMSTPLSTRTSALISPRSSTQMSTPISTPTSAPLSARPSTQMSTPLSTRTSARPSTQMSTPVSTPTQASTSTPTRSAVANRKSNQRSRHIPNAVKRNVSVRDQGRCRFVGLHGDRCQARSRLEFHHILAFGLGGPPTEANVILCCRTHNVLFAERDFTREHIQRCIRAKQVARSKTSNASPSAGASTSPDLARVLGPAASPNSAMPSGPTANPNSAMPSGPTANPNSAMPSDPTANLNNAMPLAHVDPTLATVANAVTPPIRAMASGRNGPRVPPYQPSRSGPSGTFGPPDHRSGLNQPHPRKPT